MKYNYLYLIILLVLFMFLVRFLIPLLIYLLPVLFVVYIIGRFVSKKKETHSEEYFETDQTSSSSQGDIIDVDYTIINEEENTH